MESAEAKNMLRILLVEDSASDAALLQENLLLSGNGNILVNVVKSLREAADSLKGNHIDAVLLDLGLPDSNGIDTVQRARRICSNLPVIVLTGLADEKTGMEAVRMGAQDYLVKGRADGWTVSRAIHYSIERKRFEEALRELNASLERKVQERTVELAQRASQLRSLAGELTLSEQRERSRLAKVLHDHIQQLLVAAKFRVTILGRGGDDVIKRASKEVEELIDESIAASRSLTAELSPPILHEAGLNAGIQWLARRMADTQGLFVDLKMEESGALPEDLKVLLFESVRELLFNVVKHANTRSAVINMRRFDGSLQVTVSDQGVGFDPTAMPAAGESGGGFGLFSIRERLELMGGTFEIVSNPGRGSRFVLSLPVAPTEKIEPQSQEILVLPEPNSIESGFPDPGRKIRVMLADDHAVVRQGIANLLRDEPDIEVVGEAGDGQEAVELAAKLLPDVILMDVSMPKLDGVEATRAIRNEFPEIRIIGLSMFEDVEIAQGMRDAGAVDYVTKSGSADVLVNRVRTSIQAEKKAISAKT
jgi:DNA-binding NarL/FixJ family response regulator/two-component sensor histidine kinase